MPWQAVDTPAGHSGTLPTTARGGALSNAIARPAVRPSTPPPNPLPQVAAKLGLVCGLSNPLEDAETCAQVPWTRVPRSQAFFARWTVQTTPFQPPDFARKKDRTGRLVRVPPAAEHVSASHRPRPLGSALPAIRDARHAMHPGVAASGRILSPRQGEGRRSARSQKGVGAVYRRTCDSQCKGSQSKKSALDRASLWCCRPGPPICRTSDQSPHR